jgi:hypothetical protein
MGMALLKGKKPTPEEFNELADAASPDSLVARRFALEAERFVRGDRSGAAALKATLASWRNNHEGKARRRAEPAVWRLACGSRSSSSSLWALSPQSRSFFSTDERK